MATKITMKQKTSSGYEVLYPVTDASCVLNLKVLNTDNATTNAVSSSEALSGSGVLNLHKVAKTGTNTDIINFVGQRYVDTALNIQQDGVGEIFNDYIHNKALGSHSSAFGSATTAYGKGSFACGEGSITDVTLAIIPSSVTTITLPAYAATDLAPGYVIANSNYTQYVVVTDYNSNTYIATLSSAFTSSSALIHIINGSAFGWDTLVSGYYCSAVGFASTSTGIRTTTFGQSAFSEGTRTFAKGVASHAEGQDTYSSGDHSHSEGYRTSATGESSHAEGEGTTASNICAHAEGSSTVASGNSSHAEGTTAIASGFASHAEGTATTASGAYAHTQGVNTMARGVASTAYGANTSTGANAGIQDVSGVANIIDTGTVTNGIFTCGTYAKIVGGGSISSGGTVTSRKNIATLDWAGNLWGYNDVRCAGTNGLTGNYLHSLSNKLDRALEKLTFVSSIPTSGMEVGYLYATGTYDSPGTPYLALSATTTIATTYSTFVIYEDQSNGNLYEYNDTYMVPHESGYRYLKSITLSNPTITETLDLTNKSKIVKYTTTITTVNATINISALQQNIEYTLLFVAYTSGSSSFAVDLVFPAELTVYSATLPNGAYIRTASIATVTFNTKIAAKATILRTEDDVFVSLTI